MRLARLLPGLAVLAMALVVAAPAAAQAPAPPSLFDQFREFCMDTRWDKAKTLAAADGRGWAEIPDSFLAAEMEAMEEIRMTSVSARVFVQDRRMIMLMVGSGVMKTDDNTTMNARLCGVMTFGDVGEGLKADAIAHLRAPPIEGDGPDDPFTMWMYSQKGDRREFLGTDNPRKLAKAMENGQINMLMVGAEDDMSMLMLVQPTLGYAQ